MTAPAGPSFALHADGFKRRTRDYEIPGAARRDDPESPTGKLPNSFLDSKGGTVGGSWVGERGFLGAAFGTLRSDYGIPSGEGTRIALEQDKQDLGAELANPFPGFSKMKVRAGFNDYEHREIEESGEVATTFKNKAWESRAGAAARALVGIRGRRSASTRRTATSPPSARRRSSRRRRRARSPGSWSSAGRGAISRWRAARASSASGAIPRATTPRGPSTRSPSPREPSGNSPRASACT